MWHRTQFTHSVARRIQSRVKPLQVRFSAAQSGQTTEAVKQDTPKDPWHIWDPTWLAVLTFTGNCFALAAAGTHDHLALRALACTSSACVASFNFLMPKPLKVHQKTAGCWGLAFAILHGMNFAWILHDRHSQINLSPEESEVYEQGFHCHGMLPKRFIKLLRAGAYFKTYDPDEVIIEAGSEVKQVIYIVSGDVMKHRGKDITEYGHGRFLGKMLPHLWKHGDEFDHKKIDENRHRFARRRTYFKGANDLDRLEIQNEVSQMTTIDKGEHWGSTVKGGCEGCRVMIWPLDEFMDVVKDDDELAQNLSSVSIDNLVGKLEESMVNAYTNIYRSMLAMAIADGSIDVSEKLALGEYRHTHDVSLSDHLKELAILGWTYDDYERGCRRTKECPIRSGTTIIKKEYSNMLKLAIADLQISKQEKDGLQKFRQQNAIPEQVHCSLLAELGWSTHDYEAGVREGRSKAS